MALYLTEGDVGRLLSMEACVEAVETAFRQWADGRADNRPRARASVRGAVLHALAAGSEAWGRLAAKVYATSRGGAHVNAVGSNRAERRELDDAAVRSAETIVVDSLEQAWLEAGDLLAVDGGTPLGRAVELKEIIAGRHPGRSGDPAITLFKSLGIGLEDLAAASLVYDRAVEAGAGKPLPSKGERDD